MRVLLVTDPRFAVRERELLLRLQVGLADEGVRVVQALPGATPGGPEPTGLEPESLSTGSVQYEAVGLPFSVRRRAARLAEAVRHAERLDDQQPAVDLVHAFGGTSWPIAAELARQQRAGLALEVWRIGLVDQASRFHLGSLRPVLFAPDESIERAATIHPSGLPVRLTPWGVYAREQKRSVLDPGRTPSVMIVASGHDPAGLWACLEGLAEVARSVPELLIFADAQAAHRARLARLAAKLGVTKNLSLIEDIETRRDLLVFGDVLLLPEARGEQRSVVLDAMAGGMIVVAARDPAVSSLRDGQTAVLVPSATRPAWTAALRSVFEDASRSRRLAADARRWVAEQRPASRHVRSVLSAYEWMARPAIAFSA